MSKTNKIKTKDMVLVALFAAVCCVCSIITIPTGIVPVTLGTFGIMVTAMILGTRRGLLSVVVFILLGAVGVPVFSGMNSGLGVIAGPTGGYIYSYILMVPLIGIASKKLYKTLSSAIKAMLGCIAAIIICYTLGTIHYVLVNGIGFSWPVIRDCAIIFIPFDILKAVIAILIAQRVKPLCK